MCAFVCNAKAVDLAYLLLMLEKNEPSYFWIESSQLNISRRWLLSLQLIKYPKFSPNPQSNQAHILNNRNILQIRKEVGN